MNLSKQKSNSMSQLDYNKLSLKYKINMFKKRENSSLFRRLNYFYPPYANINKINYNYNIHNLYNRRTISENSIISIPTISKETTYNYNNKLVDKNTHLNQQKINKIIMNDLSYYQNVFPDYSIFKMKKNTFNNTLNLYYSENEKKLENKMEIDNKKRLIFKKPIKFNKRIKTIKDIVNQLKIKIKFMKNVSDFSFPGFLIEKVNIFKKNNIKKQIFIPPTEKKLNLIKIKNKSLEKYLTDCININKYKNKNISSSFN